MTGQIVWTEVLISESTFWKLIWPPLIIRRS